MAITRRSFITAVALGSAGAALGRPLQTPETAAVTGSTRPLQAVLKRAFRRVPFTTVCLWGGNSPGRRWWKRESMRRV
ncbi:MAG: twin-arginine translocation signal domain-containing protein [Terriglobia bacterium]